MLRAIHTKAHVHGMLLIGARESVGSFTGPWATAVGAGAVDVCVSTEVGDDVADALAAAV